MVHALEKAHQLLQPTGILIDVHPIPEPPSLTVRLDREMILAGWVQEDSDYNKRQQAEETLDMVVANKLFRLKQSTTFTYITYSDSIADLQNYLLSL